MVKTFLTLSEVYPIDRTDGVTLNNSYLDMKVDVMNKIRGAIMEHFGLTLATFDAPTATGTQSFTDIYNDDAGWGMQFRCLTNFTVNTASPFTITITLSLTTIKNGVTVVFNATRTIANSIAYPTEVRVDADIIMVKTPNIIRLGFTRADGVIYALTDIFLPAGYALVRYWSFPKNKYEWGWVSDSISAQPIHHMGTALVAYAYPVQLTAGYLKTDSPSYRLMSMREIYFSGTNSSTDTFICRMDCDNELLFVAQPSPTIPTGNKVKVGEDIYYVVQQLNGKAVLALI